RGGPRGPRGHPPRGAVPAAVPRLGSRAGGGRGRLSRPASSSTRQRAVLDPRRVRPVPPAPPVVLRRRGARQRRHLPEGAGRRHGDGHAHPHEVLPPGGGHRGGRQLRRRPLGSLAGRGAPGSAGSRPALGAGVGARLTDPALSMGAHLTDSALYGHLWATDELRRVFDEGARVQGWLDVLATLAQAQAELGIIPEEAAKAIAAASLVELLDLGAVAEETRRTGHSTLGLIRGLQAVLPDEAREWVYYGATVQDLTDTWSALAAKKVLGVVWRDLRAIEEMLLALAEAHREPLLAGRH